MNRYLWLALAFGVISMPGSAGDLSGLSLGQHVFLTYCAGCHGFDGLAYMPGAPSFAMGDRLRKGDGELLRSIKRGVGAMPSWEAKLPGDWLEAALRYIRHMDRLHRAGKSVRKVERPPYFYVFPPPGRDFSLDWDILP